MANSKSSYGDRELRVTISKADDSIKKVNVLLDKSTANSLMVELKSTPAENKGKTTTRLIELFDRANR